MVSMIFIKEVALNIFLQHVVNGGTSIFCDLSNALALVDEDIMLEKLYYLNLKTVIHDGTLTALFKWGIDALKLCAGQGYACRGAD